MEALGRLNWVDVAVVCAYLVAIVAFGSWFGRFQKTTRDYFLTGRSVPWWGVRFTIVARETSTLSFIGVPAEILASASERYSGNLTCLQLVAGYVLGRILVSPPLVAGIAAVGTVWWTGAAAWTWYSAIGAAVTVSVAWIVQLAEPAGRRLVTGARRHSTGRRQAEMGGAP